MTDHPTANFAIGTSSTTANDAVADSTIDMSLDDIISNRRKEAKQQDKNKKRGNVKAQTPKKPTTAQKAVGSGKAKKAATARARRGIAPSAKASNMDVEKEIYRQARRPRNQQGAGGRGGPNNRRSRRIADVKVKQKVQAEKKKQNAKKGQSNKVTTRPPTKKALKAAVSAMTGAGYKPPEGMQMVISFAPAPAGNKGGGGRGSGKGSGRGGGRGGRGRGRGGGRR
eukprot:CAMPEP_0185734296 /NCGR_PEP_ID=MMETSP1171-20130828/22049_1 /TAXON_ID=374046 /ORGANISM="Helicotheca tamensis, Strain CCMP826" /LENGTH=225 /DNA_ID=CAMNT_0028404255 /DNA_START=46 /DNA_END=726 /DNA_ORIENTATION=+